MSINVAGAMEQVKQEAASRLRRAALYFQQQHQQRVGVSNPRPHKNSSRPGEYPKSRTGEGQAGVVYGPESLADIMASLKVRLGLLPSSKHLAIHEFRTDESKRRLGFLKTAADLEPQIKTILS